MKKINILITGGTGTLGKALVKKLLQNKEVNKIVVLSRDEFKQFEMKKDFPEGGEKGLRYFIGDIRDRDRLIKAFKGIGVVIHTAAMKQIDTCEYNPNECLKTNVIGTQNVIDACIANNVAKAIFISTDKAPNSTTIYGASKLVSERLFINANTPTNKFSCVRYGNVLGSRGSIIPKWAEMAQEGKTLGVTDFKMTRFFWTIDEASQFIISISSAMEGGEIFLPNMNSYHMLAIAMKIGKGNVEEIGMRGYEKLHEILLTKEEVRNCYENDGCYVIYPFQHDWCNELVKRGNKVKDNFEYISNKECKEWK